jgi:1-pyrroline-5-carboxylate dehydrogenase
MEQHLSYAAGNLYINDKTTGAFVGLQPFGGARGSGTNEKVGSKQNISRWMSPRTIKENFAPSLEWRIELMQQS